MAQSYGGICLYEVEKFTRLTTYSLLLIYRTNATTMYLEQSKQVNSVAIMWLR